MNITADCARCGARHTAEVPQSVNVTASPELKEQVRTGSLFTWTCPHCGTSNLLKFPFLYHDPKERLMLVLTDAPVNADGVPDGYTGRLVRSVGELIEKINVFDAGLDDMTIELCKYVTRQELRKDVALKFLKMDGADGEMTFTYPEKGEMQLLAVGFNVYEDCAAILQRNPHVREAASGLVTVDQAWLSRYFR